VGPQPPNPQTQIPNPQSPIPYNRFILFLYYIKKNLKEKYLFFNKNEK